MGKPGPGMLHGFFVLVLFCRTQEYILYIHKKDEGAFFSETDYTTCAYE